ncbi:MAG TPA: aminodeoxychorismate synthase, component I, partial [Pseudoxanthomonas sp.]|nr:aminodeoxychorismate synthase, component I [Pseudoxanthomonas sp.]
MLRLHPLPADTDLLALHRLAPARYPLLLESVASGTVQGRWDLLLRSDGGGLRLDPDGTTRDLAGAPVEGNFLHALDACWRNARAGAGEDAHWPFRG